MCYYQYDKCGYIFNPQVQNLTANVCNVFKFGFKIKKKF